MRLYMCHDNVMNINGEAAGTWI